MKVNERGGRFVIDMPAVLDLPAAAELRDLLIDATAHDTAADISLDCSNVERVSTAALQVILAGATALRLAARRLVLDGVPSALAGAFRALGLADEFDQLADS